MSTRSRSTALFTSLSAAIAFALAWPALAAPPAFIHAPGAAAVAPVPFGSVIGERILATLESMKAELNLTPAQQFQFDYCLAQSRTLKATVQSAAAVMKQTIDTELAKPQPDLARVAATSDQQQAIMIAARQAVRADWLQLYAMLSPDQQGIVGARLQKAWQKLESAIEFFRGFAPAQR